MWSVYSKHFLLNFQFKPFLTHTQQNHKGLITKADEGLNDNIMIV